MNSHIAWLRVLEKIKIQPPLFTDSICELIENSKFENWQQIEETFFAQDLLNSVKKDDLRIQWLREMEKVKSDIECGINYVCWGDWNYPSSFRILLQPPLLFSYIGKPCWLQSPCLSVVGSREPHPYTVAWMKSELRDFIKNTDVVVVSGGARGVDFIAHSLCLDLGRPTLVMLPSGLKQIYPPSLNNHVKAILEAGGCLISEYDSNFAVRKHLFQHRNRLIAALNHALLIGEANIQSGTIMTAHIALEMGRPVWVVPGHPLMSSFAGSLDLVLDGGQLVRNAEDLKLFFDCELNGGQRYRTQLQEFDKKVKKNEKSL